MGRARPGCVREVVAKGVRGVRSFMSAFAAERLNGVYPIHEDDPHCGDDHSFDGYCRMPLSGSPVPFIEQSELERDVQDHVRSLSRKEKRIIIQSYGIFGEEPRSMADIANWLGITVGRAYQIRKRALRKLRHSRRRLYEHY